MFARTRQYLKPRTQVRRRRSGSVLILVVALLVLMALMGTAFISSSRSERGTAVQNTSNTEIDLLLNSMKLAVGSTVAADRFGAQVGGSGYAPASPLLIPSNNTFANWDSGLTKQWLADRTPEQRDLNIAWTTGSPPGWKAISFPVIGNSGTGFESPYPSAVPGFLAKYQTQSTWDSTASYQIGATVSYTGIVAGVATPVTRNYVCIQASAGNTPTSSPLYWTPNGDAKANLRFEPTSLTFNGQMMPAMNVYSGNAVSGFNAIGMIAAADADGDGMADSGLFKLPTGPMSDGITYYGALRIIDNNAAINANTAWSVASDYDSTGAKLAPASVLSGFNPSIFPSNVGLQEFFSPLNYGTVPNDQTEMNSVNSYRMNITNQSPPTVVCNPDLGPPSSPGLRDDNGALRDDFTFFSQSDLLYHQLSRRQENPAYRPTLVTTFPYQSFPLNDSVSLASQFCVAGSAVSTPVLQTYVTHSLNGYTTAPALTNSVAPTTAYAANDLNNWFNDSFNYGTAPYSVVNPVTTVAGPFYRPMRSQITTVGAVNNSAPTQTGSITAAQVTASLDMLPYTAPVWDSATPYIAGAWVEYTSLTDTGKPTNQPKMYRCLISGTNHKPDSDPSFWLNEPWSPVPQKTNVNTATFREMWRSYYAVMADNGNTAPNTGAGLHVGQRMFKSSVRPIVAGTTPPDAMADFEQMQLRSALAAVNAETLRSGSDNVISHIVAIYDQSVSPPVIKRYATVYGQQPQPFITEVFVHVDTATNKPDYVAIELYNPYEPATVTNTKPGPTFAMGTAGVATVAGSRVINLGCHIGIMDRTAIAASSATPSAPSAANCEDIAPAWAGTDVISPGSYLVVESDMTKRPAGVLPLPAGHDPVQVPQLMDVFAGNGGRVNNGEFFLTRTRSATGIPATVAAGQDPDAANQYDETVGLPLFLSRVPMDQFDFTGWGSAAALAGGRYDYTRPTPPTATLGTPDKLYWRCVFPNAVTGAFENTYYPVAGGLMMAVPVIADTDTANPRRNGSLGAPDLGFLDATGTPTADALNWPAIQLFGIDWPGPAGNATTPSLNMFPFGGFGRLGDILQVPFIGAYTLSSANTIASFQEEMSVSMDSRYGEDSNPDATPGTEGNLPPATVPANDGSLADNVDEQVGRFCPLAACRPLDATGKPHVVYTTPTTSGSATSDDYYWWASRLFDYFSVTAPNTETFPDGSPYSYPVTATGVPSAVSKDSIALPPYITFGRVGTLTPASVNSISALNLRQITALYNGSVIEFLSGAAVGQCVRVSSYVGSTQTIGFQTVLTAAPVAGDLFRIVANPTVGFSTQGLININTASWKVLSMLPLVRNLDGSLDNALPACRNDQMAQAIVSYRNTYGPFKSIFDLNNVPLPGGTGYGFQSGGVDATSAPHIDLGVAATTVVDARQGDIFPVDTVKPFPLFSVAPPSDGVARDFKERFLAITRISNMITTRSDSFTAYVLVQGWRNAGTAAATMVSQKRMAFLLDRSLVGPTNFTVQTTDVPTP